jgi:hypothetical protein
MSNKNEMWDLEIYEIKIGGVKDGLSYFQGQVLRKYINGRSNPPIARVITHIIRDVVDNEVQYQVYSADINNEEDIQLEKVSIGLPVYLQMKTLTNEDS